ncbi:DUF2752 domain-containing protein [Clostridium thermarum]|uniref:DUF2752 domain-containing protein n=1 Tax=Clostridium thermarum TaxID=1716543 RepID=UPI0013D1BFF2|nr:DUF2752 domain-containing protein [Clostridium thermarum]
MNYRNFIKEEHIKTFGILAVIGAVSILIGFLTDRSICLFYNTTGVPCPGCGMTRAFLNLFNGHISEAFHFHPLFPLVLFIPFLMNNKKKIYLYSIISIFIAVWLIRLKLYYPDVEPMTYHEDNLFTFIKSLIEKAF